jgi:hypothetical protein
MGVHDALSVPRRSLKCKDDAFCFCRVKFQSPAAVYGLVKTERVFQWFFPVHPPRIFLVGPDLQRVEFSL